MPGLASISSAAQNCRDLRDEILMTASLRSSLFLLMLFSAACTNGYDTKSPAFYDDLAAEGAAVNGEAAASMISDYRQTIGLNAVELDPTLMRIAEEQVRAMAKVDKLTHDPGGRGLAERMKSVSFFATRAAENIGAGYHTLAEAFSGWRDSPSHNKNMLMPGVTKMGIATAYVPKSKYKVYWALVLAEPDAKTH
jgi:uncharacterized protein YkwD